MLLPFITDEHPLDFCAIGEKPDHNWCRNYILFLMSKLMHGKRNIRSNSAPKIRHIGGKTDRHWCWYLILFLMSEILNGWRNICSTFAPKLSCIGGKTIMVGAGIKSSFRCKKIYRVGDKHLLNFGAKTKPHWRETRPWLVHSWNPLSDVQNAAREEEHPSDFSTKHNSLQVAVFNSPNVELPLWHLFFFSQFFFFADAKSWGCGLYTGAVYTTLITVYLIK